MSATPARIGFITNAYRRGIAGPNTDIEAQFGAAARDTPEPVETFFESASDAGTMAEERLALLGAHRRMLEIDIGTDALAFDFPLSANLPTVFVTDDEKAIERDMIVVGIEADLNSKTCQLRTWG